MLQPPPTVCRRWLDAFVALPDRLRMPLAVLFALLAHGLVMLIAWLWPLLVILLVSFSILPESCTLQRTAAPPEKRRLEVTIVTPTPPPAPVPAKPLTPAEEKQIEVLFAALPEELRRQYIDVDGLAQKKNMSKRALLESWVDSVAGSRKQGTGDGPLPAQEGREDLPFINFKNQQATLGDPKKVPGAEDAAIFKPKPVKKDALDKAKAGNIPEVAETAKSDPPKPPPPADIAKQEPPPPNLRQVASPAEDEIPLFVKASVTPPKLELPPPPEPKAQPTPEPLKPTPVPVRKPATLPSPEPKSVIVATKHPQDPSRPMPVSNPGYSPHLEMKKTEGGKAPVGDNGVDAVATTRGRYVKSLNQAVGSRWTYYVRDPKQASLIAVGSVTLKFSIDARCKLIRMSVTENTSNSAYASLCERSFLEALADFDKPPPELLRGGVFEDTFTFTIY